MESLQYLAQPSNYVPIATSTFYFASHAIIPHLYFPMLKSTPSLLSQEKPTNSHFPLCNSIWKCTPWMNYLWIARRQSNFLLSLLLNTLNRPWSTKGRYCISFLFYKFNKYMYYLNLHFKIMLVIFFCTRLQTKRYQALCLTWHKI